MEIPERLNIEEIVTLYEDRRPKTSPKLPEIEQLPIKRSDIQEKINATARNASQILQKKAVSETIERNGRETSYIPLVVEIVDPSIPLTLFIFTSTQKDTNTGEERENVHINLLKAELKGKLPQNIWEVYKKAIDVREDGGREIGGMKYEMKGNTFVLKDRFINPKFRRQGMGSLLLEGSESLMQQKATDSQEELTTLAETAQLDVICWLWNNGYRPQTPDDQVKFEQIINGDETLWLGENFYVFPQSVPPQERTWENRRNAYRIKLEKRIQPGLPEKIKKTQITTRNALLGNTSI